MAYLTLSKITKRYGDALVVDDFNLEMEKGEFVSFLGPSGCGKTTTLRMVAGFEIPTSGKIILSGDDITSKAPNQRNVGMIFQAYALFPNMTVAQNIGFGLRIRKEPESAVTQRVKEMISLINLEKHADKYPYQLSGGQQQRVALARALANRPQVLLLDEPLSALDAKIRVSLRNEIRAIQKTLGITAIFVTHDQEEALSISDRVVVMYDGKVEQLGTPSDIYNFPKTAFVANFVDAEYSKCRSG
jgi:putative spermidine/putrescine transport system ATP-binding protein